MEYLINKNYLPLTTASRIIADISSALDYIHEQHILHCDIQPRTIFVDTSSKAYLLDFGMARILNKKGGSFAFSGGSPVYSSPEIMMGAICTKASDIYSIGIVLYEMVAGRTPFNASSVSALTMKHFNDPVPPISQFRTGISSGIEEVLFKALAKNPKSRYKTSGDLYIAFNQEVAKTLSDETNSVDIHALTLSRKLRTNLPNELQDSTNRLANLISAVIKGTLSVSQAQNHLVDNELIGQVLHFLDGKSIISQDSLLHFGSNNQFSDITIRDIVGGNIIHLNINIK